MKPTPPKPDAFVTEIAAKHGNDLLRFLSRRVATAADGRDLAQEAYVRLLRLENKELILNPQAHLYRIAGNLLYEFQLKRRSDVVGLRRYACRIGDLSALRNENSAGIERLPFDRILRSCNAPPRHSAQSSHVRPRASSPLAKNPGTRARQHDLHSCGPCFVETP